MPLATTDFNKMRSGMEQTLDLLGVPGTWTEAKPPNSTASVTVGVKTVSWRDEELVNAYGINARVFTMKATQVATLKKFDTIQIGNERYTMDAAVPVYINNTLVFWKGICRGD